MYGFYDETHVLHGANRDGAVPTEVYLEATGTPSGTFGEVFIWTVLWPATVKAFGVRITTLLDYNVVTTLAVWALEKRPAPGDTANRTEIVRMTIIDALTAGGIRFVRPRVASEAAVNPGDQLAFRIITAGVGGGAIAGDLEPFVVLEPRPETAANMATPTDWSEDTTTTQV